MPRNYVGKGEHETTSDFVPTRYHQPPCTGTVMTMRDVYGDVDQVCIVCGKPPCALAAQEADPLAMLDTSPLSETQRQVVEYCLAHPGCTQKQIAEHFGFSTTNVQHHLRMAQGRREYWILQKEHTR